MNYILFDVMPGSELTTFNLKCIFSDKGAFKADDRCYATFNLRNDVHGYCKRTSRTTYMACAPE
jgi:hypothetical protein